MSNVIPVTIEDYQECLVQPSRMVQTSMGPVEYAVRGDGPVLLSVHGGPGGFDQGLAMAECFRKNGFKVLAPSRPGYLKTPLGNGASFEEQADMLAALIEALDMGRVSVVGASAGGPPSYTLAQRHPDKVAALIEIDSVSRTYTKGDELSRTDEMLYLSKPGLWLMDWFMRHFPASMVRNFLATESTLEGHELDDRVKQVVKDPIKLCFVRTMTKTMSADWGNRKAGVHNDLAVLGAIDRLPLNRVACPTLIFHGNADGDVPPDHADYAHQAISGSELYRIDTGSHIAFWIADGAEQAQEYAVAWLRKQVKAE